MPQSDNIMSADKSTDNKKIRKLSEQCQLCKDPNNV